MKATGPYSKQVYYDILRRQRNGLILFVLITVLLAIVIFPVCDNDKVSYLDGFRVVFYHMGFGDAPTSLADYIFWENLMPRTIAGLFVGGILGLIGTIMQYLLANPLADPYTTGISSSAGLGAVIMISLGICIIPGLSDQTSVIVNAFVFSLIPVVIIGLFGYYRNVSPSEMILIGTGMMFFFSAATSVVMLMANPDDLNSAYTWGLGNLGAVNWQNIAYVVAASIIGAVFFKLSTENIRVMANRDNVIFALGMKPRVMRMVYMVAVSLVVAAVVCFTGTIGFVGLVAPHVVRLTLGSDIRYLMPASFFTGAIILLGSDAIARMIAMPVGVVTSILGGALFFVILVKQRKAETAGI